MFKHKRIIVLALIIASVIVTILGTRIVNAIWDSNKAVRIKASDIENSTLIIGTHLIHLSALTDELYEIAYQSAADSQQMEMYYKSELADGVWVDLGSAESVLDLTNAGNKGVSDTVIEGLYFEYHTKSDGITYDLRSKGAVCIYDIINPYDLETMEELEPLKNQYQMINEQIENDETLKPLRNKIMKFFANKVEDDYTEECDKQMEALYRYWKILNDNNGSDGAKEVANKVMSKVDSVRRAYVLEQVGALLDDLSEKLNAKTEKKEESDDAEDEEEEADEEQNATSITETLTSIYSSVENIENSYIEQSGNMLLEGITVLSKTEYEESIHLINHAMNRLDSECDIDVDNLSVIYNVNEGVIVDRTYERTYLTDNLIKRGEAAFQSALAVGINDDYRRELSKNSSRVILNNIVTENKSKTAGIKGELEFIMEAALERLDSDAGINLIVEKLNEIGNFKSVVPFDAFQESAIKEVENYREWLENKLKDLKNNTQTEDELGKLYDEKQDLQQEKMEALDNNNLDEANRLNTLLAQKDEKIAELEDKLAEEISEISEQIAELKKQLENNNTDALRSKLEQQVAELETKLAEANTKAKDGSRISAVAELKKSAMEAIASATNSIDKNEATGVIGNALDGLEIFLDTNTKQVYDALKNIYSSLITEKYLNDFDEYDSLIKQIETLINDNIDLLSNIDNPSSVLSSDELTTLIEDMTQRIQNGENISTSPLSQKETESALLAGLAQYADAVKDSDVNAILELYAEKALNSGNEQIFKIISGTAGIEYIPAKSVALAAGYRYIWNDTFKTATLALGAKYYAFTAFSDRVVRSSNTDQYDMLTHANEFKGTVYINSDYIYQEFDYDVYSLGDTGYAVLVNEAVLKQASQVSDVLINEK